MRIKALTGVALLFLASLAFPASVRSEPGLAEANAAYEKGDYPKVIELLRDVAAREPQNSEAYLLLAKTYFQMRDHDRAVANAEKAVALDPNNSVYHEWLGRTYGQKATRAFWFSALSLAKRSRKEFETAVQLDERNFAAMQALIEYDCSAPGIAGGGEEKARAEIARIAALDAAEGHYALGNCRRQKKDFATADAEFTKALESDPKSADLIYDIGDYAMKRSQPDRLFAVVRVGLQVAPADPRDKFYLAVAHVLKSENLEESRRLLGEYLTTAPVRDNYPSPSWVHYWLGRSFEAQNQLDKARDEYRTAVKLDSDNKPAKEALDRISRK
jgi:tetratricopeptide (TPR) repeat protein